MCLRKSHFLKYIKISDLAIGDNMDGPRDEGPSAQGSAWVWRGLGLTWGVRGSQEEGCVGRGVGGRPLEAWQVQPRLCPLSGGSSEKDRRA